MTKTASRLSPEERVRVVREHAEDPPSQSAVICSIAEKIRCRPETLPTCVRTAARDEGTPPAGIRRAEVRDRRDIPGGYGDAVPSRLLFLAAPPTSASAA